MGGLRLVTSGESSRQGDVSRELAVLDPLPPPPALPGDCMPQSWAANCELSSDVISERPKAEADLTIERER